MTDPEDGRREHSDNEFIDAIDDGNRTTQAIADYIGITRQGADYRLRQLQADGIVTSEKVGGTLLWSKQEQ